MGKKNIFITFSGMDGTGKTTLAMKIGDYLKKNHPHIHVIHGHQYAIAKKSFSANDKQVRQFRLLFSLLTPLAYVDNIFTYYKKYLPILAERPVISDRYFYDKVARLIFYGLLNKPIAQIYLMLLPKPDYIFFLDVDEQTAWERKKEYTIDEYRQFRAIYKSIAHQLNAEIINTNDPLDLTVHRLIHKISLDK